MGHTVQFFSLLKKKTALAKNKEQILLIIKISEEVLSRVRC